MIDIRCYLFSSCLNIHYIWSKIDKIKSFGIRLIMGLYLARLKFPLVCSLFRLIAFFLSFFILS